MDVPHEGRLIGRGGEEDGAVAPVAVGQGHVARGHVVRQERGVRKSALEISHYRLSRSAGKRMSLSN